MAAGRVTCLLILLLIATWISFQQASQGWIPDSSHKISTGKVIIKGFLLDGEPAVTAATSKNWLGLGGRKLVVERQMKKKNDVKMSGVVGGSSKFSSTNSKCDNILGFEQTVTHFSDEVESGFVAFNDYPEPRDHPPENN
ncbi:hypothetical protein CRYUN_Cryun04dG0191300 [Craigia yunnanensis]